MVLLKKMSIENFLQQEVLYSKLIRGDLSFVADIHLTENGKRFIINITRDVEKFKEFMEVARAKDMVRTQQTRIESGKGVLRLNFNDKKFMLNGGENATIIIREENFNPKDISVVDFPKGKASISIEIVFEEETDNAKVKKELKDYFTEEHNEER